MSKPSPLAEAIVAARREGRLLDAPPPQSRPTSLAEAHAIADRVTAALGGQVSGWKIGATASEGQKFLGLDEPFWGAILAPEIHIGSRRCINPLGAPLSVEPEVVMQLAHDIRPGAKVDLAAAVSQVRFGIEVNRPSFREPFAAGALCIIADKGANRGLVLGAEIPEWRTRPLKDLVLELRADGQELVAGSPESSGFDPWEALAWLIGSAGRYGLDLRAGQWVATGAVGGARRLGRGQSATVLWDGREVARMQVGLRRPPTSGGDGRGRAPAG